MKYRLPRSSRTISCNRTDTRHTTDSAPSTRLLVCSRTCKFAVIIIALTKSLKAAWFQDLLLRYGPTLCWDDRSIREQGLVTIYRFFRNVWLNACSGNMGHDPRPHGRPDLPIVGHEIQGLCFCSSKNEVLVVVQLPISWFVYDCSFLVFMICTKWVRAQVFKPGIPINTFGEYWQCKQYEFWF